MNSSALAAPRLPGLRRGVVVLALALSTAATAAVLAAPARAAGARVPASQPLIVLLHDHIARTRPNVRAHRIETVPARRPLTGVRTVLPVIGHATSKDGRSWARVRLPGRPSGHTGWLPTSHTKRAATPWRLALKLSTRRVTVYEHGHVARRFPVIVGTPSTPTPRGRFFIEEPLALAPGGHGGPFALATSARSAVLQEFEGGPGQIALHGTNGLSGALGTAASHGCIRLSTDAITWLSRRIGSGVPLTVTG
jgi:lipoprotein-anchoring transpeptidase ErfK/SrfK